MAAMLRPRHALLALSLAAAACMVVPAALPGEGGAPATGGAPAPQRVVEPARDGPPPPRGAALLREQVLAGHARARADVGLPALRWDDALARSAGEYAQELARTGTFRHADQHVQGENLFTGTRDAYSYAEMVAAWVDEKRDFVNAVTPAFSRTGRWSDVAHYTQIVWRGTDAVGCALASGKGADYLVCRYSPPGNVVGRRVY